MSGPISTVDVTKQDTRQRELHEYRRALRFAKTPSMQLIEKLRVDVPKPVTQMPLF